MKYGVPAPLAELGAVSFFLARNLRRRVSMASRLLGLRHLQLHKLHSVGVVVGSYGL